MEHSSSVPALEGLAVEAVEWLPSGADSGLVRVRGRWTDLGLREPELPALVLRRAEETRRFESLPDARFGRDPAVWRATFLVPAALMDPEPDELWLSWESGARAGLPAPARGFEPPATPIVAAAEPEPGGEVIDRAVLAERRARRAEAAEQAQARRAAEALKAVEVLELRSAELERRLEALQSEAGRGDAVAAEPAASGPVDAAESDPTRAAADPSGTSIDPSGTSIDPTPGSVDPTPAVPDPTAHLSAGPVPPASPDAVAPPSSPPLSAAPSAAAPSALSFAAPGLVAPEAAAGALADALAAVKRLRYELGEQRQRLRKSELLRAADAVALASLSEEEGRARRLQAELTAREREFADALGVAESSAAEAAAAREQAAEQVASAARRAAADAEAVRSRAAQELAAERAASAEARAELATTVRELAAERTAHAGTRERLATRERELTAIGEELAGVRNELAAARQAAERRAVELESERRAHQLAATERETARAGLALAESARSAETVARAALDDELDRERVARAELIAALEAAHAELTAAHTTRSELVLSRERARAELTAASERAASAEAAARTQIAAVNERTASELAAVRAELEAANERTASELAAARAELAAANDRAASTEAAAKADIAAADDRAASAEAAVRAELAATNERASSSAASAAALRSELAAAETRIADLERQLEAGRGALDAAGRETGGLLVRIAELERASDHDLDRSAREQAAAASAVAKPAEQERRELTESFDAAAAALRARAPDESEPGGHPPAQPAQVSGRPAVAAQPMSSPPPAAAAVARPARPQIVTEAKHPPRGDVVGSSKRSYPWLRGALVKLAHDDPRAATRLVLGLVPAQRAFVASPLEYDLTIRGSGTYAISIDEDGAQARSIGGPRPREQAEFHAALDIVTLTELLAGVEKRMGRWIGSVRLHGRRRSAASLRAALVKAELDLAAAARAGADLDPDLVFRAFAYAIHPSWTKGHAFTVAQELAGPQPMRWYVAVRDGKPVTVERRAPAEPPDAVVSMTRDAFTHLLRGEPAPSGDRPLIRGDRAAVAALKGWTDRAQGS